MKELSLLTRWSLIVIICCSLLALALLLSQARGQKRDDHVPPAAGQIHWTQYESALAHKFLPEGIEGVCEWEVLGQAAQEVFVWAVCQGNSPSSGPVGMSAPAVIHLEMDGQILAVAVPRDGTLYSQDVTTLFPRELHERIFAHTLTPEIEKHLQTRLANPDTPPWAVLTGTPLP
ncbi:hypothetical protein TFLX_04535 [Thermoflexales bacterium]|nr:hypothetical protein TFLX_04535 [Thermoflexales bacterium]